MAIRTTPTPPATTPISGAVTIANLDVLLSTRARLQPWYQPNFSRAIKDYSAAAVAPHGGTVRAIYTVPANRMAMMVLAYVSMMRDGATATPGLAKSLLDASFTTGTFMEINEINGVAGTQQRLAIGAAHTMLAADFMQLITGDTSTGGTYSYHLTICFMEFDT